MGFIHYFGKDEDKRSKFIFNLIAPLYGRLSPKISRKYDDIIDVVDRLVGIKDKQILDIGTGTAAWAVKFKEKGAKVVGIDSAEKMVREAKKLYPDMEFYQCEATKLSKFDDESFDIVTASYVLHGVKKPLRTKMLEQISRVCRSDAVFLDFAGKVGLPIRLLEALERSDMPYFKEHFADELKEFFPKVRLIKLKGGAGLYFAKK